MGDSYLKDFYILVEQLDNIGDQGNINKVGKEDEQADKSMEVFSCDDDSDDGDDEVDDCDDDYDIEEDMDSEDDVSEFTARSV